MVEEKARVVSRLEGDWNAMKSLLEQVPEGKMEEPGVVKGWSVKDLMGHITSWQEISLDRVKRLSEGTEIVKPYNSVDEYNAQEYARKRTWPLDKIKSQFEETHARLIQALQNLPDHFFIAYADKNLPVSPLTFKHLRTHSEDIRKWLKTLASE